MGRGETKDWGQVTISSNSASSIASFKLACGAGLDLNSSLLIKDESKFSSPRLSRCTPFSSACTGGAGTKYQNSPSGLSSPCPHDTALWFLWFSRQGGVAKPVATCWNNEFAALLVELVESISAQCVARQELKIRGTADAWRIHVFKQRQDPIF